MQCANKLLNKGCNSAISNIPESIISFMEGKNVLVFDTETTGLPNIGPCGFGSYYPYYQTEMYKQSRLVSIAWSYIPNFSRTSIDSNNINHYLRQPEGFTEIPNSHIHGITFENAQKEGIPLLDILDKKGLGEAIDMADYVVAHNAKFDYNILQSDLYRIIYNDDLVAKTINNLKNIEEQNRLICTGELGKTVCKMTYKNNNNNNTNANSNSNANNSYAKRQKINYKMPKLIEMYRYFYNKDFDNQHNASADVWALLEIMKCL
jgi:DNA polymerase-3 subunit alpha